MLFVHRWTRYGKDRLYVTDRDGCIVGSLDLVSGSVELEQPVHREEFDGLLRAWFADNLQAVAMRSGTTEATAGPEPRRRSDLSIKRSLLPAS